VDGERRLGVARADGVVERERTERLGDGVGRMPARFVEEAVERLRVHVVPEPGVAESSAGLEVFSHPAVLLEIEDAGQGIEVEHVLAGEQVDGLDLRRRPVALGQPSGQPRAVLAPVDVGVGHPSVGEALGLHHEVREGQRVAGVERVLGGGDHDRDHRQGHDQGAWCHGGETGRGHEIAERHRHQYIAVADLGVEGEREVGEGEKRVPGEEPHQRMAAHDRRRGRARPPPRLAEDEEDGRLEEPEDGEVVPDPVRETPAEEDDAPVAPLREERRVERGEERRRHREAQPRPGRRHQREA